MNIKKSYIPIKIFISYLVLAALFVGVSWFLYSENKGFSEAESKAAKANSKILKVSNLLSNIYETESLARITIQSDSKKDFQNYISKTDSLKTEIDSLKLLVTTQYQITLLDSVKLLLSKKTNNIKLLKAIKNKTNDEAALKKAINDLTKMESSLRKLQLEDFIKRPSELGSYQRNVLKKYVDYLNENIPDDSTNTLSKKESDSIIMVSKNLLNEVKNATLKKKFTLNFEENKLLQNELLISDQLRKVLSIIEREIIRNTTRNYLEKEKSLKRNNQIVTIAAVLGLFSTLFFLILILSDFSKTQSYKKQLEEANSTTKRLLRNREQLISTVSHDLKTPLSTIVGYTELLGNSELTKKQLYFANNIKGSSEYITKLIQDLLDFTQIEAGKITIEKIPFSLPNVIHEVAKSIQSVYEQKLILLSIEIDAAFQDKIIGDPFRLRQVVTNLIGNAFKFTTEGFIKIEVKSTNENQFFTIRIEDSGIGIQDDKQQLIFEEFTQADENIEKKYGGTGLGLTISKKMVEILGGKLSLKSVHGKGSIFEIQLPLLFDFSSQKEPPIASSSHKLTAVVVDDDINLLNLTTEILQQNNFKVLSFNNASAALEAMESNSFDFVITDIQMPEIDGFLFFKKLKESVTINVDKKPVIAITGRTDLETEIYIKAGFTNVIRKPYSPKILVEIIDSILTNGELQFSIIEEVENRVDSTKRYSLTSLKLFLSNDEEVLKEFLLSFKTSTKENLSIVEEAISEKNILKVKEIAHRMNSMFKQIEAHEIVQILSDLEYNEISFEEIEVKFKVLKNAITSLFLLLKKEIT
ncbi:hybrid sensor histidine kinase/response regulator [Flavobacterium aquariorum]|uniref:histidine kinase n=1 Tax=Flavobacterium aquariorum TaxID=2217670 RepID=A0A2W7UIV1_9FLAO|nr:ATP-binding protein [Flavobacterium aquariorum]PZX95087.1 hybrid sensor histidine kinase/response regulator [Flavobacterium aquariorum]